VDETRQLLADEGHQNTQNLLIALNPSLQLDPGQLSCRQGIHADSNKLFLVMRVLDGRLRLFVWKRD
jgi:hypothetical protein